MKWICVLSTALILAVIAAPAAFAGNFYVGGAIGQTSTDIDSAGLGAGTVDDEDTGYKVFGGYTFFEHFAVEAGYIDVGESSVTASSAAKASTEADGFAVEAVGMLPVGERFNVFAKYGWFVWDATVTASLKGLGSKSLSDDGTDPTYGVGFGWNVFRSGNLRFEAERYEIDTVDVDTFLVGYAFSF